jgi:hypothetical protein
MKKFDGPNRIVWYEGGGGEYTAPQKAFSNSKFKV